MSYTLREMASKLKTQKQNVYRFIQRNNILEEKMLGNKKLYSEETFQYIKENFKGYSISNHETIEANETNEAKKNQSETISESSKADELIQLKFELIEVKAELKAQQAINANLLTQIEELKQDKSRLQNSVEYALKLPMLLEATHKPTFFERLFSKKNKQETNN